MTTLAATTSATLYRVDREALDMLACPTFNSPKRSTQQSVSQQISRYSDIDHPVPRTVNAEFLTQNPEKRTSWKNAVYSSYSRCRKWPVATPPYLQISQNRTLMVPILASQVAIALVVCNDQDDIGSFTVHRIGSPGSEDRVGYR